MILIYITAPNTTEAKRIASELVQRKLIACANIFPIESIYTWEGKIRDEKEVVILGKTSATKSQICGKSSHLGLKARGLNGDDFLTPHIVT